MSEIHDAARRIRDEKEQLQEFVRDLRPSIFQRRLRALRSRLERLQESGPLRRTFLSAALPARANSFIVSFY
jgi:uncharacterized membrane protein YccC